MLSKIRRVATRSGRCYRTFNQRELIFAQNGAHLSSNFFIQQSPHYFQYSQIEQIRAYAKDKGGKGKGKANNNDEEEGGAEISFDKKDLANKMTKFVDAFKLDLGQVRTGRANPGMLENIKVKLESGETQSVKVLGSIVVKNARLLSINVFDQKNALLVAKAIQQEDLGFTPQTKHNVVDVPVPKMTQEIRDSIVKMIKRNAENTKEKIRGLRRDSMQTVKKVKNVSKDDVFKVEKDIQQVTDEYIKKVDDLSGAKEKEILQQE